MKFFYAAALFFAVACHALADQTPLVDFSDPAVVKGIRFASQKGGEAALEPVDGGVKFVFKNVVDAKLTANAFNSRIADINPDRRPREFYLTYRVRSFDGTASVRFFAPYSCSHTAAFKRTGKIETMRLRPEIVSMRKNRQYDSRELTSAALLVSGSGEIELFSFGATDTGADAVPHDSGMPHVDPDEFAIFPEPRMFRRGENTLPLAKFGRMIRLVGDVPPGPVDYFRKEMGMFYGFDYQESDKALIEFAVAESYDIERYGDIKFDGFAIDVSPGRIRVAAKEQKGLVFGIHVLCDIIKMSTGDVGVPKIRVCTVVDWPRFGIRVFSDMFHAGQHRNKYEPDTYADMLERFAISSRFNMFSIEPSGFYKWVSVPDIPTVPQAWTRDEFEQFVDRVNANAFEVMPKINGLGHVKGWPLADAETSARFGEDGSNQILCTRNPETQKVVLDSNEELLSICSKNPKYAPKYFHAGLDECRWQTDNLPPERHCRRCAGVPKNRIFLEQVKSLNDWCRSKGLRMVMWSDMIRACHNGLNKFMCYEIEPEIPKDVIYANWSSYEFFEIPESVASGHENWLMLTGYKDDSEGDEYVTGHGLYICTDNWWLSRSRASNTAAYGIMAQRILSDAMWRRRPSACGGDVGSVASRDGDGLSLVRRWGDFLMRNWSRKPIPSGSTTFSHVELDSLATLPLCAGFDAQAKQIGGVAVRLVSKDGKVNAVEARGSKTVIGIGRKAASLAILHAATVPADVATKFYSRGRYAQETFGPVIAEYEVEYEDGSQDRIEIRFGWNTAEYFSCPTLFDIFARYPADCRSVMTGALPKPADAGPRTPDTGVATMYEWVNPYPRKTIKSVSLVRKDSLARYAVMSISARNPTNQ